MWTNLPTVAARVKEITHQLTGLSPSTDYLVEASYTPRYEDPVVGRFTTQLEDLRNKLGEVRVNGNAIEGWELTDYWVFVSWCVRRFD